MLSAGRCGAVLALGLAVSIAASGCAETRQPPSTHSALADSADQVMFGARFNLTESGVIRAELNADTAYFFDDNTRIEFDDVRSTFYTVTGMRNAVLTSRRGRYNTRAGDMTAMGNVVVVNESGRRLVTPELHYSQARNEFFSDSQFVLTEPGRQLSGIGFRSDPNLNNVRVLRGASGSVTGTASAPDDAARVNATAAARDRPDTSPPGTR